MSSLLIPPITTGQKPAPKRAANEELYDRACNAWFSLVERAERIAAIDRTRDKLVARLDDPALADEYPSDHPDRVAAEDRHYHLGVERRDALASVVRSARAIDRAYRDLPRQDRAQFATALRLAWLDHPAVELIRSDPKAGQLPVWADVLAASVTPVESEPCPF